MKKTALTLLVCCSGALALACGGLEESLEDLAVELAIELEAGAAFGRSSDQEGCLSAALDRSASCTGSVKERGVCRGSVQVFLQGCLGPAAESAGFCDGAPKQKVMDVVNYGIDQCDAAGRGEDEYCADVMRTRGQWCHGR